MVSYLCLVLAVVVVSADKQFVSRQAGERERRIINGVEAASNEFPHMVTYLINNYHQCGGVVIANGWVLTAGHCVSGQNLSSMAVVTNLHDFDNPVGYEWFDIDETILHPDYNTGSGATPNDLALLRLRLEGRDTSNNAIGLITGDTAVDGETCSIAGWGYTTAGAASSLLQRADVTVLSHDECLAIWGSNNLLTSHVCVTGTDTPEGTGACSGDTGGPVTCAGGLAGIISWGPSGCHTDGVIELPTVGARVSSYIPWISEACGGCV